MTRRLALLTRPEGPAAAASLKRLEALGWRGIHAPLTRMEPLADPGFGSGALDPAASQALIFTSAEGVRRFAALSGFRGGAVHAVGRTTAQAARAVGFAEVEEGGGDARRLGLHLRARLAPGGAPALHVCAEEPAGDLVGDLAAAGIALIRIPLYRTEPLRNLPEEAESALRAGNLRVALLYAPSAARAFAALCVEKGFPLDRLCAAAISPAAAAPLADLGLGGVLTAPHPDEAHLLGALAGLNSLPGCSDFAQSDGASPKERKNLGPKPRLV